MNNVNKEQLDKFPIRCSKCNTVFGSLAHLNLYNKRICNKCCPTSKFDSKKLFIGCDCKSENKSQLSEEEQLAMIPGYKKEKGW